MPSSALVAAAEAAPPLRRRQRRPVESVTLRLPAFRSLVLPLARDWAGLPPELLSCIFHRLDHVQIMLVADKVCRSWRRAARDEPELWRRIDMRGYRALSHRNLVDLRQMAVEAVRRSQGQCQAFSGDRFHGDFILFLGNHAPLLKSLILVSYGIISGGQGFMQAIKGFPLLEELHLSEPWYMRRAQVLEVIAQECPGLKHLRICDDPYDYYPYDYVSDGEAMAIAKMQELRSLQLINSRGLTNQGLMAILDSCLHLRSVDILGCNRIEMTPEMEARTKVKKLFMNYSQDGRWDRLDDEPGSPTSECSTCFDYFRSNYEERYGLDYGQIYPSDGKEAMLISAVRELRSLELHRNDLTSKGLAAVLDKCPHLDALDVWNLRNIAWNNNPLPSSRANKWWWHREIIKTKKLTTKLLRDRSMLKVFNPAGLDIRNCRNIVMDSFQGRRIIMDNTLGAKCKRLQIRKLAKKFHERTKKMIACIEREYLAKLSGVNYKGFEEFGSYRYYNVIKKHRLETGHRIYNYHDWDWEFGDEEFEHGSHIRECSTCLMFEYLAERWGVLDLDDYADYYDSSYGLDEHDETEFQVHDRMLGKRFRRYL